MHLLFHDNSSTEVLHGGNHLLSILLGHVLLHGLGRALDELLGVHQTETQRRLDLLDNLGLGGRVESLQLEREQVLLLLDGSLVLGFLGGSSGGRGSGGEATNGQIGDVELVLGACQLLYSSQCNGIVFTLSDDTRSAVSSNVNLLMSLTMLSILGFAGAAASVDSHRLDATDARIICLGAEEHRSWRAQLWAAYRHDMAIVVAGDGGFQFGGAVACRRELKGTLTRKFSSSGVEGVEPLVRQRLARSNV